MSARVLTQGFLPDSPEIRYELILRSLALMLSTAIFNAIEVGIAVHDKKPGSILNNAIGAGLPAFAALGLVFSAWRHSEMAGTTPLLAKIAAMGGAFSAMLAFSATCASLTSVGNQRFIDGMIEGGVATLSFLFISGFALLQRLNPNARTQTSILDVITCREAPDQRAIAAGSFLGNVPAFATFAYFDWQQQRFGSFTGCAISILTNTSLFVKTIHNASKDTQNAFSYQKCIAYLAGIAGFVLLCGSASNYMNGRSSLEYKTELFSGAALLLSLAIYKVYGYLSAQLHTTNPVALAEEGRAPLLMALT